MLESESPSIDQGRNGNVESTIRLSGYLLRKVEHMSEMVVQRCIFIVIDARDDGIGIVGR